MKRLQKIILSIFLSTLGLSLSVGAAAAQNLCFAPAQGRVNRTSITAVGDLLFQQRLIAQGLNRKEGFESLWTNAVAAQLRAADLTYGNLEGPVARGMPLSNRQMVFNFPFRVLGDLENAGFDVLSLANNHSLDRGPEGADRTLDSLSETGLLPIPQRTWRVAHSKSYKRLSLSVGGLCGVT